MSKTLAQRVAEAKANIENLTPEEVADEIGAGALLVDLREPAELTANGTIAEAIHAPRGMLEFYADPTSTNHRPAFSPEKRVILHCVSGVCSALAARSPNEKGYSNVAHLDGGINAWKAAGLPVA